jgi:predicted alpha/beta superfamily hydrolase
MKKITFLLLSMFLTTKLQADGLAEHRVQSRILNTEKRIWIYEPTAVRGQSDMTAVYMLDGQNAFDERLSAFGKTWDADIVADTLIQQRQTPPFIVIGIESTSTRLDELTPPADADVAGGGNADKFLLFLNEELIPWVEDRYKVARTPENRVLVGSSLGGLFVTYAAFEAAANPVFGRFAALSPSVWWANQGLLGRLSERSTNVRIQPRSFYFDVGLAESRSMVSGARTLKSLVAQMKCPSSPCAFYTEDPQGKHDELAWGSRLPGALRFLFGSE